MAARSGAAVVAAVAVLAWPVGWVAQAARLAVADLPWWRAGSLLGFWDVYLAGLVRLAIAVALLAVIAVAAYGASARRWHRHGGEWDEIVRKNVRRAYQDRDRARRPAPADRLLRVVAGYNLLVLAGVVGVAAGQALAEWRRAPLWLTVVVGVAVFLAAHLALTHWGPLRWRPGTHFAAWVAIVLVALLVTSPPVGLLILTGVLVALGGRRLLGSSRPRLTAGVAAVAAAYVVCAIAALAMPPVGFDRSVPAGGFLNARALVTCDALADATAADVRLIVPRAPAARRGGRLYVDDGRRPSLLGLVLTPVHAELPAAWLIPSTRARQPTCAGAGPARLTVGQPDPRLGPHVIAGPLSEPPRALYGEAPIGSTTDPRIARLALRYQPTLLVTVADRFWPVAVGTALHELGTDPGTLGQRTCLVLDPPLRAACRSLPALTAQLSDSPREADQYLRYPTRGAEDPLALTGEPAIQQRPLLAGLGTPLRGDRAWELDPGALDPWRSAEVYFFFAGAAHPDGVTGRLPPWPARAAADGVTGLMALEYWFFYTYNYYPVVDRAGLMEGAPLAGDQLSAGAVNADLHQGDWEHVIVLLEPRTLTPRWLYTARHDDEGAFIAWDSPALAFDGTHPIVQAAFGGHPTYPSTRCGEMVRHVHGGGLLSDWVVCSPQRYGFRAATTPLVDLGSGPGSAPPWACWTGHFGEANAHEHPNAGDDLVTSLIKHNVHVAGPVSPLWQAENGRLQNRTPPFSGYGVCAGGAASAHAPELDALSGPLRRAPR